MQDDKYKVKYGQVLEKLGVQKVLLTFSGGLSSLVLLDVIASLLQEQILQHKGKQGFELIILTLDEYELKSLNKNISEILPLLLQNYAPAKITFKVLSLDSYIDLNLLHNITVDTFKGLSNKVSGDYTLFELLASSPNKSSTEDLLTTIFEKLTLEVAYQEGCQTILYGHSMTRIANEIISLTVKGRGSSVYKSISDHIETYKDQSFQIIFPLREILFAEIVTYCDLSDLKQHHVFSTLAKSKISRNLTIRDLTTNYFDQLDATGYASTASTVVKTGEKLGDPAKHGKNNIELEARDLPNCRICGVRIHHNPSEWLARITVTDAAPIITEEEEQYYKLYQEQVAVAAKSGTPIDVCYGCVITLGGIKDTGFIWPLKEEKEQDLKLNYVSTNQDILDEFILTDTED